jgi:predicted alpha/beta-hydrolase family hydrolase
VSQAAQPKHSRNPNGDDTVTELLTTGPETASTTLILAHGAGAAMDSPFMNQMAALLEERRVRVVRFEFPYMASQRATGKRRPPPKAEMLQDVYRAVIAEVVQDMSGKLAIGGKSMGGRVASLVAGQQNAKGVVKGLVCLGYPFHPPGMPEKLRTTHLEALTCPALIVQGERDPFGGREEVEGYALSPAIRTTWMSDGDHDFGPRGGSGFTRKGNLIAAADAVAAFLDTL